MDCKWKKKKGKIITKAKKGPLNCMLYFGKDQMNIEISLKYMISDMYKEKNTCVRAKLR